MASRSCLLRLKPSKDVIADTLDFNFTPMSTKLITNANIVNEGKVFEGDVLIKGQYIEAVGKDLSSRTRGSCA